MKLGNSELQIYYDGRKMLRFSRWFFEFVILKRVEGFFRGGVLIRICGLTFLFVET